VGYQVDAADGQIGKVDEATYDVAASYIVVDTGAWIFGKKVMLPAGVITEMDHDRGVVSVSLSREQIKNAPELDDLQDTGDEYRGSLGSYYTPFFGRGPSRAPL
jgi:hypothetical protein